MMVCVLKFRVLYMNINRRANGVAERADRGDTFKFCCYFGKTHWAMAQLTDIERSRNITYVT